MSEDCPLNSYGHKFFVFQVRADFEPVIIPNPDNVQLYQRVEYAITNCNCGEVRRKKVVQDDDTQ